VTASRNAEDNHRIIATLQMKLQDLEAKLKEQEEGPAGEKVAQSPAGEVPCEKEREMSSELNDDLKDEVKRQSRRQKSRMKKTKHVKSPSSDANNTPVAKYDDGIEKVHLIDSEDSISNDILGYFFADDDAADTNTTVCTIRTAAPTIQSERESHGQHRRASPMRSRVGEFNKPRIAFGESGDSTTSTTSTAALGGGSGSGVVAVSNKRVETDVKDRKALATTRIIRDNALHLHTTADAKMASRFVLTPSSYEAKQARLQAKLAKRQALTKDQAESNHSGVAHKRDVGSDYISDSK
jgi:hypothetical protein